MAQKKKAKKSIKNYTYWKKVNLKWSIEGVAAKALGTRRTTPIKIEYSRMAKH